MSMRTVTKRRIK